MPYGVDGNNCVRKRNKDGSLGKLVPSGCYPTRKLAAARATAMNINVEKGGDDMSKVDRIKAKRRKARQIEKERQLEEDAMDDVLDDTEEIEEILLMEQEEGGEEEEKERKEKYYYEEPPMMGATSFEELDNLRAVRERTSKINNITYDTEILVHNILYSPVLDPDEKANKVKAVSGEMASRIDNVMDSPAGEMKSLEDEDLEILAIEAIIAHDERNINLVEKVSDWLEKKKLSYASEQKLSDSDFALVRTVDGKKVRKYPIHDKAHVRNALARASQQIKKGGPGATDAKAALPKIRAAAKKFGIEMSMQKDRSAVIVEKDAQGNWRWIGWASNNFKDLDWDILSEKSHKDYVAWLDANPDMAPELQLWHRPGTRQEKSADFWGYENGFLILSGVLTEKEAQGILRAMKEVDLGMSLGFFVFERDLEDRRIVQKYRAYESSLLPLDKAANPFTDFDIVIKEAGMETQEFLSLVMGEEKAKSFMDKTGLKQKQLREAAVEEKEEKQPEVTEPTSAKLPAEVIEALSKEFGLEGLSEFVTRAEEALARIPELENKIKELTSDSEEKVAEMISPNVGRYSWMIKNRASQSDKNVLDEKDEKDEKLLKSQPEVPWLSDVFNSTPLKN